MQVDKFHILVTALYVPSEIYPSKICLHQKWHTLYIVSYNITRKLEALKLAASSTQKTVYSSHLSLDSAFLCDGFSVWRTHTPWLQIWPLIIPILHH